MNKKQNQHFMFCFLDIVKVSGNVEIAFRTAKLLLLQSHSYPMHYTLHVLDTILNQTASDIECTIALPDHSRCFTMQVELCHCIHSRHREMLHW